MDLLMAEATLQDFVQWEKLNSLLRSAHWFGDDKKTQTDVVIGMEKIHD